MNLQCSIVIPVYGDGRHVDEIIRRLDVAFKNKCLPTPQVILVDDCGPGDAWSTVRRVANNRPSTVCIQLMRNFGQHNAIMCGFHYVTGEIVITLDDDLQHVPECVPSLIQQLEAKNADLVYGVYESKKHAVGRNLGSWLVNQFYRMVFGMPVTVTSLRAVRKALIQSILRYDFNFTYIDGLLAWNTQRIETVTVPHSERAEGVSGYTLGKLVTLTMNVFTNFSLIPLQCVSFVGMSAASCGIALGIWYLVSGLMSEIEVPGYASTIVAVLVLGGLQLLSLGVIGEYVGRLHLNVNRKPQFAVRELKKSSSDD